MKNERKNLTDGSLWKGIWVFSVPLILSNILQILFNMSDIAVVGRFAGSSPLGSVGSTTTLVSLFTEFLIGVGSGVNVLTAQSIGKGKEDDIRKTVHTSLALCLIVGILVMVIGEIGGEWILKLLKTKEELLDGAVLYLRIYFLGMPALALYNFGNAVFSASGDTRKPLIFLSIAGVLNIVLNLFFVIVVGMDVAGVAIASVVSQYVSAVGLAASMVKLENACRLRLKDVKLNGEKVRHIMSLSLPAGIQNALFQVANLFVQLGVNSFSATVVAGNVASQNADALVYNVMQAFYVACGSYIGQNYGAGKMDRVRKSYLISMFYAFAIGLGMGLTLVLFGRTFLSLFTTEEAVVEAGLYRLTVMGFSYGFSALMDASISASRGLGRGMVPTIIVMLGTVVFRVAWIFTVFAWFGTITSLYLLFICSWMITGAAEAIYFRNTYRKCEAS